MRSGSGDDEDQASSVPLNSMSQGLEYHTSVICDRTTDFPCDGCHQHREHRIYGVAGTSSLTDTKILMNLQVLESESQIEKDHVNDNKSEEDVDQNRGRLPHSRSD